LNLTNLARQLGVDAEDLLAEAHRQGLAVSSVDSTIDASVDFALRRATIVPGDKMRPAAPPLRETTPRTHAARHRSENDLSDMTKVVLRALDADPYQRNASTYRPRTIATAKEIGQRWAACWFEPAEVDLWMTIHPSINPVTAYALKKAGLTPQDAAEQLRYARTVAIAVSIGEVSAEDAAAELKARRSKAA
jgi:hypothetical protein